MTDFSKVTDEGIAEFAEAMRPLVELRLPFPPSVNGMYKNRTRGRAKTDDYEKWIGDAGWELNAQKPKPVAERCNIFIDLDDRRNGDADNRAKGVLDLLVKHRVLKNDSKKHVKRVSIGWEKLSGCRVRIMGAAE